MIHQIHQLFQGSGVRLLLATGMIFVAVVALTAIPVFAQEPAAEEATEAEEPQEEAEATEDVKQALADEIVVTARRREENVQEVPIAVSVITGETLQDVKAKDISILQDYTPNMSIYEGRNQSTTMTVFLRGIGQADPLWGVDPGVGLYFDDVYIARPQGALLDVFDVQRVEILRGPQGTLYGKNTIGGAIKYVSRPPTDIPEAQILLTAGNYSQADVRAIASGPLIKGKLRGKIAFAKLTRDGYGTNLFTGREVSNKDTTALRLGLDWLPSDRVTVSFAFDISNDRAEPKGLTRLAANPLCPLFLGVPCPPEDNIFDTRSGLEPKNGTDYTGYALNIRWAINDNWLFRSITAYRDSDTENNIDFDTTPAPITDVEATYFDDQTSQEFQFLYDAGGRMKGVLGFYYFDGFAGGLVKNNFLNAIFGTTDGDTKTESIALFGDGSYAFNDKATFNFGLRATQEDKSGRAFNAGYTDSSFEEIAVVTADYDKTATFNSLAPRLGFDYLFNPDVMGYISYSRGFKSGGFNVRAQATVFPESADPFDDEKLDVVEVGVKSVLADRQLLLNAAVFYGQYTDIQVSTFTSYDSNGDGEDDAFFGAFGNAGDATNKGVELEYDFSPQSVSWFGLNGFVAYLDATPDEFLDENMDGFVDTQVITNAPEWTAAIYAKFDFPAFGGLISGSLGYSYRADSVLTNEGGPDPSNPTQPLLPIVQPAFGLWNSWIGWFSGNGKWRFTINGVNLADEEFLTNGYNIPVLGLLQGSYGTPQTISATFGYTYK
jgi:iron complex outermembrane receptor protein